MNFISAEEDFLRLAAESVRKRVQRLGVHYCRTAPPWTEEELVESHSDMTTTARTFLKETGTNRTMNATKAKARLVMLIEPTAWTGEEDAVLKAVFEYHDTWAARLSAFQLATGRSRTVRCLTKRAKVFGLDLVAKGGKPWTEEEDKFLEYPFPIHNNWKDIYDKSHRKFGPNRTFISIQAKRASRSHPLPSHQR